MSVSQRDPNFDEEGRCLVDGEVNCLFCAKLWYEGFVVFAGQSLSKHHFPELFEQLTRKKNQ